VLVIAGTAALASHPPDMPEAQCLSSTPAAPTSPTHTRAPCTTVPTPHPAPAPTCLVVTLGGPHDAGDTGGHIHHLAGHAPV
jgi:hypothetical protein